MKISVHISFYLNSINNKKKLIDFNKILNNFSKLSKQTHIFVHTNEKKLNINKKKIKVIYHNLKNVGHIEDVVVDKDYQKLGFVEENRISMWKRQEDDQRH